MFNLFRKKDRQAEVKSGVKAEPSDGVSEEVADVTSAVKVETGYSASTVEPTGDNVDVVIRPKAKKEEHVCDENCKHEQPEPPPLTHREAKYLKRSKYDPSTIQYKTSYVLKNKRTGQIAEIRAASSFHACNIIGWKPNRVTILDKRDVVTESKGEVKKEEALQTAASSSS